MVTLRVEFSRIQINTTSVMPCHLNGDVHEWFNEVVTVPNWSLLKTFHGEETMDA